MNGWVKQRDFDCRLNAYASVVMNLNLMYDRDKRWKQKYIQYFTRDSFVLDIYYTFLELKKSFYSLNCIYTKTIRRHHKRWGCTTPPGKIDAFTSPDKFRKKYPNVKNLKSRK